MAFLDRLYTAKRRAEERIVVLGGEDDSVSAHLVMALKQLFTRLSRFRRIKFQNTNLV